MALAPPVIVYVGRRETAALQASTHTIPIVFMQVNDPVEQGLVASLARPGGTTTGFTQNSSELDPKRLQLLHEIAPSLSRAAFLVNPDLTPGLPQRFARAEAAAKSLGIALRRVDAATSADLPFAFVAIDELSNQTLLVQSNPMLTGTEFREFWSLLSHTGCRRSSRLTQRVSRSALRRALSGFTVMPAAESDKLTRFGPFSSQCRAGNVKIRRAGWNEDLFRALEVFPRSRS